MKQTKLLMLWVALAMLVSSCSKDEDPLFKTTHPEQGQIALRVDWSERGTDVLIPGSFTAVVGGQSLTVADSAVFLLLPGNYSALLFSETDKVAVSGGIATVATTDGITNALPGWFFSGVADITSVADRDDRLTVVMQQQTRELTIVLTVADGNADIIERVEGALTGIASTLDLATGEYGGASTVEPVFNISGNTITASLRLLGVTGDRQELTLQVYIAGLPMSLTLDLTEPLGGFNSRKNSPLTINSELNVQNAVHPTKGTINLTADWSESGDDIPASYRAVVGIEEYYYTSAVNTLALEPGAYQAILYNAPENITVAGNIATVSANALPGWFFSGAAEFDAEASKVKDVSVAMHRRVREMTLELTVAEGNTELIERITGSLSGIASTLNLATGELGGKSTVETIVTIDGNKVTVYLRLLGTIGDEQQLTLYIYYTDGVTLPLTIDLTEPLENFNNGESAPIIITDEIVLSETSHPGQGKVRLTTDWSRRGSGVTVPSSYNVVADGTLRTFTSATNAILLDPGTYSALLYNTASGITISGNTAKVNTTSSGYTEALPGWLFSGTASLVAEADSESSATALMNQLLRQATFTFNITSGDRAMFASATASLSNVASSVDLLTGSLSGSATVSPVFQLNGNSITATVRLLGITTPGQRLDVTFRFNDNTTRTVTVNLTESMQNFNESKSTPFTYSENINIPTTPPITPPVTPPVTPPAIPPVTGDINDWNSGGEKETGTAE